MTEPQFIDTTRTVFPVTVLAGNEGFEMARPDSFGTAFCASPGVFLTAAHVVHEALTTGRLALTGPAGEGQPLGAVAVSDYQIWDDVDVAVLFAPVRVTVLTKWLTDQLQMLDDVSAFGYPHLMVHLPDEAEPRVEVVLRAYKGHVIATRTFRDLPAQPAIYELSCPYPPGMSGAPVLYTHKRALIAVGMAIGCPLVEYRGLQQRVGAALLMREIGPLWIDRLGCQIGGLPGIEEVALSPPEEAGDSGGVAV